MFYIRRLLIVFGLIIIGLGFIIFGLGFYKQEVIMFMQGWSEPTEIQISEIRVTSKGDYMVVTLEKASTEKFYGKLALYERDLTAEIRLGNGYFRNDLRNFDFIKYIGDQSHGIVSYRLGEVSDFESLGISEFTYNEWQKILDFVETWPELEKSKFITELPEPETIK